MLFTLEFKVERQFLWKNLLPELRNHYRGEGLEVQFMDIHHGSLVDHALDGHLFSRHLQLISDCYRQSVGPFFLVIVFHSIVFWALVFDRSCSAICIKLIQELDCLKLI